MHAGTAEVTALIWDRHKREHRKPPPLYEYEMRIACIFRITPPFRHEADIREREWLNKTVPLLPLDMAAAIRALLALWSEQSYQRECTEAYRAVDALYKKCGDGRSRPGHIASLNASCLHHDFRRH